MVQAAVPRRKRYSVAGSWLTHSFPPLFGRASAGGQAVFCVAAPRLFPVRMRIRSGSAGTDFLMAAAPLEQEVCQCCKYAIYVFR